ncbi:sigma factor-like helix-turn-helix DNA-binding protein [Shewanella sp. NIFS-20-20]|uniref:sigma factor-like helix-turn-helix DNA-binding protein n=1 Tax=Shewanella sp. NIFS-20-20 TaxID=2853806 RepID=UPI00210D8DD9|nr:sigma factor-like helix-turn-helix DNA-binding protein [Shewanella sp. NIFS-20-20]
MVNDWQMDVFTAGTDEWLMQQYALGNATAFEVLYERHSGHLFRYFHHQLDDAELVNCVFQQVWQWVVAQAPVFTGEQPFAIGLYCYAHKLLITHLCPLLIVNSRQRLPKGSLNDGGDIGQCGAHDIRACLSHLPWLQKEAVILQGEMAFSIEDIGAIVGITVSSAERRLGFGIQQLRQQLIETPVLNKFA